MCAILLIFAHKRQLCLNKSPCCCMPAAISVNISCRIWQYINIARVVPMVWIKFGSVRNKLRLLPKTCIQFALFSLHVPELKRTVFHRLPLTQKSRQHLSRAVINDFTIHFQIWALHIFTGRKCIQKMEESDCAFKGK